jgi:hypothetical protein
MEYPMSHIGMRQWQWREMLELNGFTSRRFDAGNGAEMIEFLAEFFGGIDYVGRNELIVRGNEFWNVDQRLCGVIVNEYAKRTRCGLDLRPFQDLRLDRIFSTEHWRAFVKDLFHVLTDAHGFHDDFVANMNLIRALNRKLFEPKLNEFLDRYIDEYLRIRGQNNYSLINIELKNL